MGRYFKREIYDSYKDKGVSVEVKRRHDNNGGHYHIILYDSVCPDKNSYISLNITSSPVTFGDSNHKLSFSPLCDGRSLSYLRTKPLKAKKTSYYDDVEGLIDSSDLDFARSVCRDSVPGLCDNFVEHVKGDDSSGHKKSNG